MFTIIQNIADIFQNPIVLIIVGVLFILSLLILAGITGFLLESEANRADAAEARLMEVERQKNAILRDFEAHLHQTNRISKH